jgi:hypothetical protein
MVELVRAGRSDHPGAGAPGTMIALAASVAPVLATLDWVRDTAAVAVTIAAAIVVSRVRR